MRTVRYSQIQILGISVVIGIFLFSAYALYKFQGTFDIDTSLNLNRDPTVTFRRDLSFGSRLSPILTAQFLQFQLQAAERNWERGRKRLVGKPSSVGRLWNFFTPTFSCPLTLERLGVLGDGGKWVCGFSQYISDKSECLVYSFGVDHETSFEEEILQRSNCTIRMFDPTISTAPSITTTYPGRAFWYKAGIAAADGAVATGSGGLPEYATLKTIMKAFGDENKIIDIFKMDVEGAEWEAIPQVLKDFPGVLPFGQFLFEIHMRQTTDDENYEVFSKYWQNLEAHGLRPFSIELNYLYAGTFKLSEFAMLNIKLDPYVINS